MLCLCLPRSRGLEIVAAAAGIWGEAAAAGIRPARRRAMEQVMIRNTCYYICPASSRQDPQCIFITRQINKLGFHSREATRVAA